ncbi:MAG: hypothetical protein K2O36_01645 [Ruminococcus sp.]|nr:hypothetical protein [Ruminococcus sp.]MDE7104563.1 hypothetical protein [Ruminococcus sp.]
MGVSIDSVYSLFRLFSGEDSETNKYFILLAKKETEKILLPDIQEDERINFLCAAIANYRYQQAKAASADSEYTYIGEMNSDKKNNILVFAENMLRDYYQLCSDIIKPQNFIFMGFSSAHELE